MVVHNSIRSFKNKNRGYKINAVKLHDYGHNVSNIKVLYVSNTK